MSSNPKGFRIRGEPRTETEDLIENWPSLDPLEEQSRILESLRSDSDPASFEELLDLVVSDKAFMDGHHQALFEVLIPRATSSRDHRIGYLAAEALRGAALIALSSDDPTQRLELANVLRSGTTDSDIAWAQAAIQTSGLLYSYWTEESIRAALKAGIEALEKHEGASGDVAVETGQICLIDALECSSEEALWGGLRDAGDQFSRASHEDEERVDAALMASVLGAMVAFRAGNDDEIAKASSEVAGHMGERIRYGREMAFQPASRRAFEWTWAELVSSLARASLSIDRAVWTNGADAVNQLVSAIEISSSIRLSVRKGASAESLVAPRIRASFAKSLQHREILRSCLEHEEVDPSIRPGAVELLEEVTPIENPVNPVEVIFGDKFGDFQSLVGEEKANRVRSRLEITLSTRQLNRDVQWMGSFESVVKSLEASTDFHSDYRQRIERLVADLLDFVSMCLTFQLSFSGGSLEYLGDAEALESQMADHLQQFLISTGNWNVESEVRNQGSGGRVDLLISFGQDRFVVECKRDAVSPDKESVRSYLAQTERYLSTSLRIGAVAVLDLSDKSHGPVRGLDASSWVEVMPAADSGGTERLIVCLVVPGNRSDTPATVGKSFTKHEKANRNKQTK